MAITVSQVKCQWCGFANVPVHEGKGGALSTSCPGCKSQGFNRSPAGVTAFMAGIAPPAPPKPAPPAPKKDAPLPAAKAKPKNIFEAL